MNQTYFLSTVLFLMWYLMTNTLALSYPWMVNDCGFENFEKVQALDGYVYSVYKIRSMNTVSALTCVMDCFYDKACMSVVYQQQMGVCNMYLTHMKDTYMKEADGNALYFHFKDPDDCPILAPVCDPNAVCINKRQNDSCHCNLGYSGDGQTCSDTDECLTGTNTCDINAYCTNSVGSYTCTCKSGYDGDGTNCDDIDECTTGTLDCSMYSDVECINTPGSASCQCKTGYAGSPGTCSDIDECTTGAHTCDPNAQCDNTVGSFTCLCNNMYEGNGHVCTMKKIRGEACSVDADCLLSNFICSNSVCDCDVGYSYNRDSNTCETKCDNYGTEFSMQSSPYCISGNNDDSFDISSFSGCRTKCLEASFTCRTFELWSDKCWLSSMVKSDVPDSSWQAWTGCQYHQRHCA